MIAKVFNLVWSIAVLLTLLLFPAAVKTLTSEADEGLRIDLARNTHIRVDNSFGSVSVEVWPESYVLVSAGVAERQAALLRSPIVIDNRNELLSISVVRRPIDPPAVIDLTIKIPESNHLEIITTSGAITMRGMPASAELKSSSGEVRVALGANVEVVAKSVTGIVRSDLASAIQQEGHTLQAHLGMGSRLLRINTQSGDIKVGPSDAVSSAAVSENRIPRLADATKAAGTPANSSDNEEVSEGDVIRVDSQLVTLNMSVVDRNSSRGLLGLTQSDFKMFEDGIEQPIVQFEASSAPFDLFLLIDLSGSTKDVLKLINQAALRFVDAARPSDRIAVVTFAGQSRLISGLTLDRKALRQRVNAIETAAGDTKLYDAIDFTVNEIAREQTKSRRTAIVLMSDGLDGNIPGVQGDGSKLSHSEVLGRIQEFDGVLYTIWLNTEYEAMNPLDTQPEAFDAGHDRMKELADTGGGIFYEVERLESLAGAYEHVVADLGTVYSLAYRPSNKMRDGRWRAIRVNISRSNAVARGKRGYYAN